jgi:hypothetical protein
MNDINHPNAFRDVSNLLDSMVLGKRTIGATAKLIITNILKNIATEQHQLREVPGKEGLVECTVCNGAEGSIPTCCPGRPMTGDEQDAVYAGTLDFLRKNHGRDASWWRRTPYTGPETITPPKEQET